MCEGRFRLKKIIFFLITITAFSALYGSKSYSILSRGLVRDNSTNLIWTRCPLTTNNKPIYDFQCIGEKKLFSWAEAIDVCENLNFEGRSDWRLPNIKELHSIVYYHHYITGSSSIGHVDETVFPNTVAPYDIEDTRRNSCDDDGFCYPHYWSSTLRNETLSFALDFNVGGINLGNVIHFKSVRCVAGP